MTKPLKALFAALLPVTLVLSAFFAACADEHEHTLESVPAVAATCTQDGNIAYWHCADCNKYFEDEEASKEITLADTVTAKLGHDFETAWLSDEAGHWHKCSRCDATDTKAAHADADEDGKCDACGHAVQQGEEPADYKLTINGAEVKLDGNTEANGGPYKTTIGENNTLNVTYTVGGQSYQNVGLTAIESVMKANDTFSATVKNNGAAAVRFRVNIFYWVSDSDNGSVNISATQDGAPVYTDTVNGGSFFDIAVGATVKIEVRYDNTKALSSVQFMIDSSCDTADERSGDVTISGMVFSLAPVAVTGVSLNKTETVIEQGKTETLTATVAPSNAANKAVTWKSSDEEVATVSDTGVVTAVAEGEAIITVTTAEGGKTATCVVTVPHKHILTPTAGKESTCTEQGNIAYWTCSGCHKLFSDEAGTLEITAEQTKLPLKAHTLGNAAGEAGKFEHDETTHWQVCSVCKHTTEKVAHSSDGANGECTVCGYKMEVAHVHKGTPVAEKQPTCTQNGNAAYYRCGCGKLFTDEACTQETTAEAVTKPALGHDFETAWLSDEAGHWHKCSRCDVTDTKAAHADADKNGKCDACGHAVKVAVEGITITGVPATLETGKTHTIAYNVLPANATIQGVRWETSDEEVATVSEAGVVTAVAPGEVTITAITEDGNKTATCTIKVTPVITEIDFGKVTVGGNAGGNPYTATVTDGKLNISYANMTGGTWQNVDLSGFAADMAGHNVFTATVKNNGTASVNLRVDILGGTTKLNASATMDGEAVNTDLVNGGSYFTIAAGEEVVIEIVYTLGDTAPTSIQFMPDSHVWQDTNTYTGDITISGCGLYKNADYVPPEEGEEPVAPPVDEDAVELTFGSTEVFTVDKNGVAATAVNVTYTAAKGGEYANIASSDAATYAAGNDTFTVTITNNSDVAKNVRIDVIGEKSVKPEGNPDGTNVCNLSHEIISGTVVAADGSNYTDTTWGGTTITVGGRSSVTVAIKYEGGNPEKWGDVLRVQFYFETSKSGDTNTYSGNFTISNFKFTSSAGTAEEGRFAAVKNRVSFSGNNGFKVANDYANDDDMFNCVWNSANVAVADDGVMSMSVTKDGASARGYYGGEYRSEATYGYGYYEVCMKPAKCSGVVSSFFTYTNSPVWDEIDIEFLGKDTTKVQFNYYVNGVGGHEYIYDLGFDASADFHVYGFDWQEGSITWYVDGKDVYTATPPEQGEAFPSHNQQIMMNVWNCTGHDDWTGPLAEDSLPATAQYKWVAYEANA